MFCLGTLRLLLMVLLLLLLLLFVAFSTLLVCGEKQREGVGGAQKRERWFLFGRVPLQKVMWHNPKTNVQKKHVHITQWTNWIKKNVGLWVFGITLDTLLACLSGLLNLQPTIGRDGIDPAALWRVRVNKRASAGGCKLDRCGINAALKHNELVRGAQKVFFEQSALFA